MSLDAQWRYGFRSDHKPTRDDVTMIDVDWQKPDIGKHLVAIQRHRPWVAVLPDILDKEDWDMRINLAYEMRREGARNVMVVPKVSPWRIPNEDWIILGYPVGRGETSVCPYLTHEWGGPIHLLGGTVAGQLRAMMHFASGSVVSADMNAHTKAARFGRSYNRLGRVVIHQGAPNGMSTINFVNDLIDQSFKNIRHCWETKAMPVNPRFWGILDES